jgi:uridine kinase
MRARIVLLCGPSGSGKSRLATSSGLPVLRLDDFYKDGDDPSMPRSVELGIVDWDDVRAWHADRAVDALTVLCRDGRVEVPTYDIGQDRAVGTSMFQVGAAPAVVAEGVFASHIVEQCRARGILADAVVLQRAPWKNFLRRLARDLAERRKPPVTLWRRGWILMRSEPALVAACVERGCRPLDARALTELLRDLASATLSKNPAG